jgi:CubicO group peptidase (beta-lactamase class C family)
MIDTAFHVPAAKRHRFASYYEPQPDGQLRLADPPNGQWSTPPALPLGNGGLASTIDDWYAFARMLLGQGTLDGRRVLSPESVLAMTTRAPARPRSCSPRSATPARTDPPGSSTSGDTPAAAKPRHSARAGARAGRGP